MQYQYRLYSAKEADWDAALLHKCNCLDILHLKLMLTLIRLLPFEPGFTGWRSTTFALKKCLFN